MDNLITLKIPILGQLQVGKSTLFSQLTYDTPDRKPQSRSTEDFLNIFKVYKPNVPQGIKFIELEGDKGLYQLVKLVFLDDPECGASNDLTDYISGASGVLLVFDVTDRDTTIELHDLVEELAQLETKDPLVFHSWLVGNKTDLRGVMRGSPVDDSLSLEEGKELAEELSCIDYYEISALTGEGVKELLKDVVDFLTVGV
ncbi:MAG: hypothetical protein ACXAEU_04955 [Candidatus Hodarchaeales archaeon]|jgi:GTPase SAR1 family protein